MIKTIIKFMIKSWIHSVLFAWSCILSGTGIYDKPFDADILNKYEGTVWVSEEDSTEVYIKSVPDEIVVTLRYNGEIIEGPLTDATVGMEYLTKYAFEIPDPIDNECEMMLFSTRIIIYDNEMIWYGIYSDEGTEFEGVDHLTFSRKE